MGDAEGTAEMVRFITVLRQQSSIPSDISCAKIDSTSTEVYSSQAPHASVAVAFDVAENGGHCTGPLGQSEEGS